MIPTRLTLQALAALPLPPGRLSVQACETAENELRDYAPQETDPQLRHAPDALYLVIAGRGTFRRERTAVAFAPGDVLFAAAGDTPIGSKASRRISRPGSPSSVPCSAPVECGGPAAGGRFKGLSRHYASPCNAPTRWREGARGGPDGLEWRGAAPRAVLR
jgi:hypothetical protein